QRLERVLRALAGDLGAQRLDLDAGGGQRLLGLGPGVHLTLDLALQVGDLAALLLDGGEQRDLLRRRIDQRLASLFQNVSGNLHHAPPARMIFGAVPGTAGATITTAGSSSERNHPIGEKASPRSTPCTVIF